MDRVVTDANLVSSAAQASVAISVRNKIARSVGTTAPPVSSVATKSARPLRSARRNAGSASSAGAARANHLPNMPRAGVDPAFVATERASLGRNVARTRVRAATNVARRERFAPAPHSQNHAAPSPGCVTTCVALRDKTAATENARTTPIAVRLIDVVVIPAAAKRTCAAKVRALLPAIVRGRSAPAPTSTFAVRKVRCVFRTQTISLKCAALAAAFVVFGAARVTSGATRISAIWNRSAARRIASPHPDTSAASAARYS